jgi:hypothetical protein
MHYIQKRLLVSYKYFTNTLWDLEFKSLQIVYHMEYQDYQMEYWSYSIRQTI